MPLPAPRLRGRLRDRPAGHDGDRRRIRGRPRRHRGAVHVVARPGGEPDGRVRRRAPRPPRSAGGDRSSSASPRASPSCSPRRASAADPATTTAPTSRRSADVASRRARPDGAASVQFAAAPFGRVGRRPRRRSGAAFGWRDGHRAAGRRRSRAVSARGSAGARPRGGDDRSITAGLRWPPPRTWPSAAPTLDAAARPSAAPTRRSPRSRPGRGGVRADRAVTSRRRVAARGRRALGHRRRRTSRSVGRRPAHPRHGRPRAGPRPRRRRSRPRRRVPRRLRRCRRRARWPPMQPRLADAFAAMGLDCRRAPLAGALLGRSATASSSRPPVQRPSPCGSSPSTLTATPMRRSRWTRRASRCTARRSPSVTAVLPTSERGHTWLTQHGVELGAEQHDARHEEEPAEQGDDDGERAVGVARSGDVAAAR